MKKTTLIFTAFLGNIAWAQPLDTVTPESVGLSSERLARIDRTFQELVDEGQIAGVSLLLGRMGQVAYRRDLGLMDVEAQKAMAPEAGITPIISWTLRNRCVVSSSCKPNRGTIWI